MPTVRAKFHVNWISQDRREIRLAVVYSGSEENKYFFSATPGGDISLFVVNPDVAAAFEAGKEYYVDFTPA